MCQDGIKCFVSFQQKCSLETTWKVFAVSFKKNKKKQQQLDSVVVKQHIGSCTFDSHLGRL